MKVFLVLMEHRQMMLSSWSDYLPQIMGHHKSPILQQKLPGKVLRVVDEIASPLCPVSASHPTALKARVISFLAVLAAKLWV